jgi:hypothetical protein
VSGSAIPTYVSLPWNRGLPYSIAIPVLVIH